MLRKANRTRSTVRRAAISAGATVAAVLMSAGGASAATPAFADPVPGIGPLPLSCTGAPIDAYTTCAVGGHAPPGGAPGDATGEDTPNLGGDNPPEAFLR